MADRLTAERPGHKRTKSALALSLLHRDKSKADDAKDDALSDNGSEAGSEAGSPTLPRPHTRLSKHKQRSTAIESPTSATSTRFSTPFSRDEPPKTEAPSLSIEQSVRMFKLFEVLRNGDNAAIAKAATDTPSLEGTTIIHLAIQCAESAVVEQILSTASSSSQNPIDVNARDKNGNTPLHLASMLGRPSTVRLLLEQPGVDESIANYQRKTPLELARMPDISQQLQLARSLYVDSKVKEIHGLVRDAKYSELEAVLEDTRVENVLDVNGGELATEPAVVSSGGTLLHQAAQKRDTQLIQILLLHGADPFRRDHKGRLPQDVTKDDRTRAILKKSPAAAAAQRGIQEKVVLGNLSTRPTDGTPGGKDSREIKGYLRKWTNYTTGYKLRWFVLEDGVLSYYKQQDDAGSACRGAINMRIARLDMDAQDKTKFEIEGKSSVKYHLRANHVVEAKRWFWVLNNAIQWAKDETKAEARRLQQHTGQSKSGANADGAELSRFNSKESTPTTAVDLASKTGSKVSLQDPGVGPGDPGTRDTTMIEGDLDDEEEYGDDASDHELRPASKDAFNITAHSASLQLQLLGQVSAALQSESRKKPSVTISHPTVAQAISTYESAVSTLEGLVKDLLMIARDRDAYWQYRLDREADVRRLWEDSMAKVAKEQEELEGRIGESEDKRKRTKKALKEALEGSTPAVSPEVNRQPTGDQVEISDAVDKLQLDTQKLPRRTPVGIKDLGRRKSTIADLVNLSDSDSDEDEEFFDAVDAGEVEVVEEMPLSPPSQPESKEAQLPVGDRAQKRTEILSSFRGYEDPVRTRLKMDTDDRPKISLWVSKVFVSSKPTPRFNLLHVEGLHEWPRPADTLS